MTYPNSPGSKVSGTSVEAATSIQDRATKLQMACLRAIRSKAMTADEVAAKLKRSILVIRPRISELRAKQKIEPTGKRRANASGLMANVWRAVR